MVWINPIGHFDPYAEDLIISADGNYLITTERVYEFTELGGLKRVHEPVRDSDAGPDTDSDNDTGAGGKAKVKRPPNAFILFRKHHHASTVQQHPNLHNNDICKYFKSQLLTPF